MELTVQQWERVAAAPVVVFLLVAFVDREISEAERKVFFKEWSPRMVEIRLSEEQDQQSIFEWGLGEAEVSVRQFMGISPSELLKGLEDTFTFLQRVGKADTIDAYRTLLYNLAEDVAKASGGLFGLRSSIRPGEEEMLRRVRHALRGRPIL